MEACTPPQPFITGDEINPVKDLNKTKITVLPSHFPVGNSTPTTSTIRNTDSQSKMKKSLAKNTVNLPIPTKIDAVSEVKTDVNSTSSNSSSNASSLPALFDNKKDSKISTGKNTGLN
jgi:hypothetical protein